MTHAIALNFHGIGEPKCTLETDEAPYWLSSDQFERILDQVVAAPDPSTFTITFDDGNQSDHDIALPALAARGLQARFFVLTGRIGHPGALDSNHILTLQEAGMKIGSHGIDHVMWPTLEGATLEQELRASRTRLEDICGCPIIEAGIPFGRYDARVLRALRSAGYTTAWSSDGGRLHRDAFLRPRTSIRGDMSDKDMHAILAGDMPPLRRLRRTLGMARRRWMVTG